MPGAGAATADNNNLFRQAASTLQAKSLAIVGASERARWPSEIYRNLREFGYPGRIALINPRQTQVFGERCFPSLRELPEPVDHALVIVPAAAVPAVLTDAEAAGIASATVYASMMGDGEHPDSKQRGAWLKEFVATSRVARRRPELHGRLFVPRARARLSQHRAVPARARSGRLHLPVRRSDPVLDEVCGRPGAALLLLHHVGQRARSRARRLSQFRHRRSADAPGRAVHRRHPAAAGVHARGRARARHGQADPRHQDRRHGEIAGRLAVAHRRHRRRLCGLSGDVRALRHRQLSLARRPGRGRARLRRRPAAERPAHRLRHHLGRHGGSALRLRRGRRRRHAGFHRRHQGGAAAADAGRDRAEKPARRRHSLDHAGRGRALARPRRAIPISTWWRGRRPYRARAKPGAT